MNIDEALAIIETVLDDDEQLNDVQELIFKQCWLGRESYEEIAKVGNYDNEYIKSTAAKLWKQLSEVFGEKVKRNNLKSVLKRYLRRQSLTIHKTKIIGVNVSGKTGDKVSRNVKLYSCFSNSHKSVIKENKSEPSEIIDSSEEKQLSETLTHLEKTEYFWKKWRFHSLEQVKIAEALDRAGVMFFPNSKAQLPNFEDQPYKQVDFLIYYNSKLGVLEIQYSDIEKQEQRDNFLSKQGIFLIKYCDPVQCLENPDQVVQEFIIKFI
ncbi:MAG: hypothetical protein AUK43_11995 [Oscillatoriales cyanobacterium CG2_30_40_61]|nr:MAG: hypothetical protein AUK43_11995 [Oscillatoriales cyanobacterium CG2_30_40_61]